MTVNSGAAADEELLANIKQLTKIVLDKLEEGSKEGTLDPQQIRLYSSIVMRSLGLWLEALNPRPRRQLRKELEEASRRLPAETLSNDGA